MTDKSRPCYCRITHSGIQDPGSNEHVADSVLSSIAENLTPTLSLVGERGDRALNRARRNENPAIPEGCCRKSKPELQTCTWPSQFTFWIPSFPPGRQQDGRKLKTCGDDKWKNSTCTWRQAVKEDSVIPECPSGNPGLSTRTAQSRGKSTLSITRGDDNRIKTSHSRAEVTKDSSIL